MKLKLLAAVAGFGALLAGPAHAAFISGSISFADGFDVVPSPPNLTCIVNCGTDTYDINNVTNVYDPGATGDFATTTSATAADLSGAALPFVIYATDSGFSFTVTSYAPINLTPLGCSAAGLCTDSVEFDFFGFVSGAGFDDTGYIGRWTGNGSCLEDATNAGQCTSGSQTASWSSSIVATQQPPQVPEPGTLALLGLGLAGLGFARRRRA